MTTTGFKTWWCVTSSYDDRGHVVAAVTGAYQAKERPESGCTSTAIKDIYTDFFESASEAEDFVKQCREENSR